MKFVLFLIVMIASNVFGTFDIKLKKLNISKKNNVVHIFLGIASNTCQLLLMEFLKLDRNIPKIVAFNLYFNMKKTSFSSAYNAAFASVEVAKERWIFTPHSDLKSIADFVNRNEVQVVFYANIWHATSTLIYVLNKISPSKVKMIYMFEDGNCNIFSNLEGYFDTSKSAYYQDIVNKTYKNCFNLDQELVHRTRKISLYLNKKYNVAYHLGQTDKIKKSTAFREFEEKFGIHDIYNVDFRQNFYHLTPENQRKFLEITAKDIDTIKSCYNRSARKKILILIGYNQSGFSQVYDSACLNMIKEIRDGKLSRHLKKGVEYQWFFKQHPTVHGVCDLAPKILKLYSDMIEIPAYIPFESIVLAGLEPDYVCGVLSAAFFVLNKKNVLFGVKRQGEQTTAALKELDILHKDNVYDLEEFCDWQDRLLLYIFRINQFIDTYIRLPIANLLQNI